MSIQEINLAVFHLLNVSEHASPLMMAFGRFIAHDLIYIVFFVMIISWFLVNLEAKKGLIKAFIMTAICLMISETLSYILNTPRPFVMGDGLNILDHSSTGSFPSNHLTIFSSIAFSYYFSAQRQFGRFLLAISALVAWSRIYVGVHYPIDMLGALVITFTIHKLTLKYWNAHATKISHLIIKAYQKLFKYFIDKGIIQ